MSKEEKIKQLMNGECYDITFHHVSAEWYRWHVNMDYESDKPVDIVQCTYGPELYATPAYMDEDEYNRKTAEEIAEAWEI